MDVNKKVEFIKKWILDYVNSMPNKAQSLVIGISGGIDSSVSSTLSAMTGLKTIVLSMPINQIQSQHDLSLKHQEWLVKNFKNVEAHTIKLDGLFNITLIVSCNSYINLEKDSLFFITRPALIPLIALLTSFCERSIKTGPAETFTSSIDL